MLNKAVRRWGNAADYAYKYGYKYRYKTRFAPQGAPKGILNGNGHEPVESQVPSQHGT